MDTLTAHEFTRLTLERVGEHDLGDIAGLLERKTAAFSVLLSPDRLADLSEAEALGLLRSVFSSRRRAKVMLDAMGLDAFAGHVSELVWGASAPEDRLAVFHAAIVDLGRDIPTCTGFDLGSELLHFSDPGRYWLWTCWMWNPETRTGSLPLVVTEDVDLEAPTIAETYRRVGVAVAFVNDVGEAAGFRTAGHGIFGTDVFLACVYGVYMYTTLRMRMTQEFNKIMPELAELVRRLLGVHRLPLPVEVAA